MKPRIHTLVSLCGLCGWLGCDEPVKTGPPPTAPAAQAATNAAPQASGTEAVGGVSAEEEILVYADEDFVELDTNRDPFRSYLQIFAVKLPDVPQRAVVMPSASIDEMRLVAIVTGETLPRAMIVDSAGVGHIARRGDYIGRPEIVYAGGADGVPITLNWRVDRIRDNELVLTREDPTAPNRPPLIRVIPLHEDGPDGTSKS